MERTNKKISSLSPLSPLFSVLVKVGDIDKIVKHLAKDLIERGKLDIDEGLKSDCFSSAKKVALVLRKQSAKTGPRSWQ